MTAFPIDKKEAELEKVKLEAALDEGAPSQRLMAFNHSYDEQVSVIRKEFVVLTGDPFSAVILNQLLYWTQRVRDFDLLLKEERTFRPDCNVPPRHGWIYKTAHDLIEETMLGISHPTMRKYLKLLIDQGWIDERAHPIDKWNKTTQYRVNLRKLHEDLMAIGCKLPSLYLKAFSSSLLEDSHPQPTESSNLQSNVKNFHSNENLKDSLLTSPPESEEIPNVRNLHSNAENFHSDVKNLHSDVRNLHSYTYTETTPKNTNREHTARAREKSILMVDVWRRLINPEGITLTDARKRRLESHLETYFQNNLARWEKFCRRIQASPFLMGEGSRGWRITLDWILLEDNLLKVLEGNFDDPHSLQLETTQKVCSANSTKISKILESIEDPIWREWCTQFSEGICLNETRYLVEPLKLADLECIANARFLELEAEKLLWVGSSDSSVLSKIEDLRLILSSYFTRTFPKFRTIRTRLITDNETFSPLIQEITPNRKD